MGKLKNVKIYVGLFYLVLLSFFLIFFFSKFDLKEVTSYNFIQSNRDYFFKLKESNLIIISFIFLSLTIFWVLLLGFGSPVALLGGFIFGKWLGIFLVATGLTFGATIFYMIANFFFKNLIREKFSSKYQSLESKFKKNEFMFFILYRFIGGIPFQIANLLPVLFNVSIKNYLIGTFLGILPALFVMVSLGSGIENIINQNELAPSMLDMLSSSEIYIPILGFVFLLIIVLFIKKKININNH
jgi:uncharacterized membrane protein YdjX (TVP38/TMEM64 family)